MHESHSSDDRKITEMRRGIKALYGALAELHDSLDALQSDRTNRASSRAGFLLTLTDIIGPRPPHSWQAEWPALSAALPGTPSLEDILHLKAHQIASMIAFGWEQEAAETFSILEAAFKPMAHALRGHSKEYAAATHTLCRTLFERGRRQTEVPQMLYCHLLGPASLTEDEDGWHRLLEPDITGFQGLTSAAPVTVSDIPNNFHPDGFAIRLSKDGIRIKYDLTDPTPYTPMPGPVVGFESAPEDEHGVHSAVMTGKHSGSFPPNCLFRLKRVVPAEEGFIHAPTGVRVMQQLLVVSASYLPPLEADDDDQGSPGSKFATPTLQYGSRDAYVRGLSDLLEMPTLTLAQEFERDVQWSDFRGVEYSLRTEWVRLRRRL